MILFGLEPVNVPFGLNINIKLEDYSCKQLLKDSYSNFTLTLKSKYFDYFVVSNISHLEQKKSHFDQFVRAFSRGISLVST